MPYKDKAVRNQKQNERRRLQRQLTRTNVRVRIELVGLTEIAAICDTHKQTVAGWRDRDVAFPVPVCTLAQGSVWLKKEVMAYLTEHKQYYLRRQAEWAM